MKTYFKLLTSIFLCINFAIAQENPKVKFGKISEEELNMKVYAPDTSAEALILFDDGNSSVKYDVSLNRFMLKFERLVRVKILKESGKQWGNFNISLYSYNQTREETRGIDGITYNLENGKIVKSDLKKDGIFKERENKYSETVKISMPAVKIGSVIDLKYSLYSPLLWNLQPWNFQYSIPVKWSHLYLEYPEYFNYNQSARGYHPLFSNKQGTKTESITYTATYESAGSGFNGGGQRQKVSESISYIANTFDFAAKEVPAIKEEPFCTTLRNFTTRIKFELRSTDFLKIGGTIKNYTNTWESISRELFDAEDFGGQIKGGNFLEDDVKQITSGIKDEMSKVIALYSYIQKNIKWDKYKDYSTSHPLRKTFADKTGNSADLNLLLLVMLQKAGIEANPVILSTRDHGILIPQYPSISDCNYVVIRAMIDGKPLFLDVTETKLPAGQLPLRCMNGNGILIDKNIPGEIPLNSTTSTSSTSVMLEMKEGKFMGKVISYLSGYEAFDFRNEIKEAGGDKEQFEKLKNNSKEIEYIDFVYNNIDSLYKPVEKRYNFAITEGVEGDNSIIYLNPILFGKWLRNLFTSPTRTYPIDFGVPFTESYKLLLEIPAGYKVEELPKSKSMILGEKDGKFIYTVGQMENRIIINLRLSIEKPLFLPNEYQNLKEFLDRVVATENTQIVLKKN